MGLSEVVGGALDFSFLGGLRVGVGWAGLIPPKEKKKTQRPVKKLIMSFLVLHQRPL